MTELDKLKGLSDEITKQLLERSSDCFSEGKHRAPNQVKGFCEYCFKDLSTPENLTYRTTKDHVLGTLMLINEKSQLF